MVKGSPNPHKGTYPWLMIVTQRVVKVCATSGCFERKRKILNSEYLKPNVLLYG